MAFGVLYGAAGAQRLTRTPTVLPIAASAGLDGLAVAGNNFTVAQTGNHLLEVTVRPNTQVATKLFILEIYNVTTGIVAATASRMVSRQPATPEAHSIPMVFNVTNPAHQFTLRAYTEEWMAGVFVLGDPIFTASIQMFNMQGLVQSFFDSARVVATAPVGFANLIPGLAIDGVNLAAGDDVLLTAEFNPLENVVWTVQPAAAGPAVRRADFALNTVLTPSSIIAISEGGVNADTLWMLTTNALIQVGVTALVWAIYNTAGGAYIRTTAGGGNSFGLPTTSAFFINVAADAFYRYEVLADGYTRWGSGAAAADVGLARKAAGVLMLTNGAIPPAAGALSVPNAPNNVAGYTFNFYGSQAGPDIAGIGGAAGGPLAFRAGDGAAAKVGSGLAGGAGGDILFMGGAGGLGDGAGAAGDYGSVSSPSRIGLGNSNEAWGYKAMLNVSTGFGNTALGAYALFSLTTGHSNTALSAGALYSLTTAQNNIAIGQNALYNNTTGDCNLAIGVLALNKTTTGTYNTAIGYTAMWSNLTGTENVAIGTNTLYWAQSPEANIAIGAQALNALNDAPLCLYEKYNIAIGYHAMVAFVRGNGCVAIGYEALAADIGGASSPNLVAVGFGALSTVGAALGAQNCVAVGANTCATAVGSLRYAVAVGGLALWRADGGAGTTARYNTAVGYAAERYLITGENNVAVGSYAHQGLVGGTGTDNKNTAIGAYSMQYTDTSSENVAVGFQAMQGPVGGFSGTQNSALGVNALAVITTGSRNTAVGYYALAANTTAQFNTAVGYYALAANTTGANNTALGTSAGAASTGAANVFVGAYADVNLVPIANFVTAIGYQAYANNEQVNAIGYGARANVVHTTQLCGALISRKDGGESDYFWYFAGATVVIFGSEVDLTGLNGASWTVPGTSKFFVQEAGLVCTLWTNVTSAPTVEYGTGGAMSKYVSARSAVGLTAEGIRERYTIQNGILLADTDGETDLVFNVTVAATADALKARPYWVGILVEDE